MVIKSVNLETVCGITSKLPDNPDMDAVGHFVESINRRIILEESV